MYSNRNAFTFRRAFCSRHRLRLSAELSKFVLVVVKSRCENYFTRVLMNLTKNYCKIKDTGTKMLWIHLFGLWTGCNYWKTTIWIIWSLKWNYLHQHDPGYEQGKCYVYIFISFLPATKYDSVNPKTYPKLLFTLLCTQSSRRTF